MNSMVSIRKAEDHDDVPIWRILEPIIAMCAHSIEHARTRGYRAMQFNFVVSTNERAVRLWQACVRMRR